MSIRTTAWKQEKAHYRKRLDMGMAIAILLMFALFGFAEPIQLKHVTLDETVIEFIDVMPEIEIPEPPPEITRPKVLIASLDEEVVEETIEDTDFDPNDMAPVPPPPPTLGELTTFDKAPKPLRVVQPTYPDVARQLGIEGVVRCLVTIDRRGNTVEVVVVDSDSEVFEAAVIAALKQWAWEPAEQSGNPVRATVLVPVRFSMEQ